MHESLSQTRWIGQFEGAPAAPLQGAVAAQAAWMRSQLHDLAQPLTALECVLFLGTLEPAGEHQAGLRQTIDEALVQCGRLMAGMRTLQESL